MGDHYPSTITRRRVLSATAAVGGSALLGSTLAETAAGGGDGTRTLDTSRAEADGSALVRDWKRPIGGDWGSRISPTVAELPESEVDGPIVYDAPARVGIRAFSMADGTRLWETELAGLVGAEPTIADGVCYVASDGGTYALDAATGEKLWSYEKGGSLGVVVGDDAIYVPTGDASPRGSNSWTPDGVERTMTAFDREDGSVLWQQSYGGEYGTEADQFYARPQLVDGTLLAGGSMGLVAMDPATGETLWQAFDLAGSMTVADGVAYVTVKDDGGLVAFDLESREQLWRADVLGSDPLVHDGSVYVTQQEHRHPDLVEDGVTALDAETGELQWSRNTWADAVDADQTALVPTTPPVLANDQVVFGGVRPDDGYPPKGAVFGLDPDTGEVTTLWWPAIPDDLDADGGWITRLIRGEPTAYRDHLLVSSYDWGRNAPRAQGLYALSWSDSPPGEGPAEPDVVQSGGCEVSDGRSRIGMEAYDDQPDEYGDQFLYRWDVLDDGVLDGVTGRSEYLVPLPEDANGTVTTTVTVLDRYGRSATGTVEFTPEAVCASFSLSVEPKRPETGEEFTMSVDVQNADPSEFEYYWEVPGDYETTAEPSYTASFDDAGDYTVGVEVRSDAGLRAQLETDLTVVCPDDA
ncbi:PQQ-binding-like beta-propeller repeat protein [Haloarchaeobius sp. HME9146]|uniref:outer membrane protein assembly factor BamB family protein n=1 Tax=Haloarchaeobius sp. HME9146 TaxID=2978732 RepID=UPI0021C109E4|nr:PQQ-binding-like beta-propeller repeat protein [Haloarchaeobius sp. HME9146]MCT9095640.1 PQQ-binding-like beta-propeller repeat protein [Haloarchaeobius sp. HME9146]